jgi:methylaspartate mutase epsilon subunit
MKIEVRQKRIDEDQFLAMRKDVLSLWPTGKEVDLDEAVAYQKNLPDSKSFLKRTQTLRKEGRTVVYTRAGTARGEEEISLCRKLEETGVPYIPVTTDSYTRLLQFKRIEDILAETVKTGKKLLNGYPSSITASEDTEGHRERHHRRLRPADVLQGTASRIGDCLRVRYDRYVNGSFYLVGSL